MQVSSIETLFQVPKLLVPNGLTNQQLREMGCAAQAKGHSEHSCIMELTIYSRTIKETSSSAQQAGENSCCLKSGPDWLTLQLREYFVLTIPDYNVMVYERTGLAPENCSTWGSHYCHMQIYYLHSYCCEMWSAMPTALS